MLRQCGCTLLLDNYRIIPFRQNMKQITAHHVSLQDTHHVTGWRQVHAQPLAGCIPKSHALVVPVILCRHAVVHPPHPASTLRTLMSTLRNVMPPSSVPWCPLSKTPRQ